jgi:glutathione S-transferase
MPILYEHPLSPYSQKVKIALREKGIDFDLRYPEGIGAGAAGGAFAAASPRSEVPALIDGETAIFDSTIILEYIEDRWPTPSLQPAGAAERARVRMIEEIVDTHYEAVNWGLGELHWFKRAEGDLGETLDAEAARQVQGIFAWLETQLGDRAWFNGAAFGRGDLCVAPFVGTSRVWGTPRRPTRNWRPGWSAPAPCRRWARLWRSRSPSTEQRPMSRSWSPRACSNGSTATIGWNGWSSPAASTSCSKACKPTTSASAPISGRRRSSPPSPARVTRLGFVRGRGPCTHRAHARSVRPKT